MELIGERSKVKATRKTTTEPGFEPETSPTNMNYDDIGTDFSLASSSAERIQGCKAASFIALNVIELHCVSCGRAKIFCYFEPHLDKCISTLELYVAINLHTENT